MIMAAAMCDRDDNDGEEEVVEVDDNDKIDSVDKI